ncbi:MAG TPA: thioredoxin family protein [Ignavibacteriaceae bacterium]|nr:thioredoxin family protein [Ignavibacteriaceae bacterium]
MKLSLIITQNCSACDRAESVLRNLVFRHPEISLNIIDTNDYDEQNVSIIPALFINDELFSYGDLDESVLFARVKK